MWGVQVASALLSLAIQFAATLTYIVRSFKFQWWVIFDVWVFTLLFAAAEVGVRFWGPSGFTSGKNKLSTTQCHSTGSETAKHFSYDHLRTNYWLCAFRPCKLYPKPSSLLWTLFFVLGLRFLTLRSFFYLTCWEYIQMGKELTPYSRWDFLSWWDFRPMFYLLAAL